MTRKYQVSVNRGKNVKHDKRTSEEPEGHDTSTITLFRLRDTSLFGEKEKNEIVKLKAKGFFETWWPVSKIS